MTEISPLQLLAGEISTCHKCPLSQNRTHAVPGSGSATADIMFVGEGPGAKEDAQGLPFVGASGKFLTEMLASIDLTRQQVFITNIVKCRPPSNRDPLPTEVSTCSSNYLQKQIAIINPSLIVTLGRHAANYFFGTHIKISQEHGKLKHLDNHFYYLLYHPAAALYNGSMRKTLLADFSALPKALQKIRQLTTT